MIPYGIGMGQALSGLAGSLGGGYAGQAQAALSAQAQYRSSALASLAYNRWGLRGQIETLKCEAEIKKNIIYGIKKDLPLIESLQEETDEWLKDVLK